jgi:hypothetical protein
MYVADLIGRQPAQEIMPICIKMYKCRVFHLAWTHNNIVYIPLIKWSKMFCCNFFEPMQNEILPGGMISKFT